MKTNSSLRERLGVYVLGIAIGLMIVGMIFMVRYQAHQKRERARQQQVGAPMAGDRVGERGEDQGPGQAP